MKKRIISITMALALILATFSFVISASGETITLDKSEYAVGATINVTFSGSTSAKDWIGVYPASVTAPANGNTVNCWVYTSSGTQTAGATAKASGSVSFKLSNAKTNTNLAAGNYNAYLLSNDGYTILNKVSFTIKEAALVAPKSVTYERISGVKGCVEGIVTVTPGDNTPEGCTYRLYWADSEGKKLEGYSMIAEVEKSYVFNEGQFVPGDAKKIVAYTWNGSSASDKSASYTFSGDELLPTATFQYSFNVFSDIHTATTNFTKALNDIAENMSDSDAIITAGDNTSNGSTDNWTAVGNVYTTVKNEKGLPPFYLALGNHDSRTYKGDMEGVYENMRNAVGGEMLKSLTEYTKAYYDFQVNGTEFIMLAGEEAEYDTNPQGYADLSDEQLDWLKTKLDAVPEGQPVFVVVHQPLYHTISGTLDDFPIDAAGNYENDGTNIQDWYGELQDAELRAILDSHPNAVLFTGHGHWDLDQTQPSLITNYKNSATYINCPSASDLWTDKDSGRTGSQGLYVEVYDKYVLIKGRDYYNGGSDPQWISCAQFMISREAETTPTITAGNNGLYKKTKDTGLDITSSSVAALTGVMVDNEYIDAENYTAATDDDKTVITLKAAYLDTLTANFHKIAIVSADGTARADFEVRDIAAVTAGDGSKWTQYSDKGLSFATNIRSRVFDNTGVKVDDTAVSAENFTVDDRGIVVTVTLNPEFLDTLTVGDHTISIDSDNGAATATFTIEEGTLTTTTTSTTTTSTTTTSTTTTTTSSDDTTTTTTASGVTTATTASGDTSTTADGKTTTAAAGATTTTAKGNSDTTTTTRAAAAVTGDDIALALLLALASFGAISLAFLRKKKRV